MPTPKADEVVELEHWSEEDGVEGEGDELEDEPSADEVDFARLDDDGRPLVDTPNELETGYEKGRKPAIPQPDRARSSPDLPKVKATKFKRFIT